VTQLSIINYLFGVSGERINVMESIKRVGLLTVGWFLIVLGILGIFLPILQGILFILIALAILSS